MTDETFENSITYIQLGGRCDRHRGRTRYSEFQFKNSIYAVSRRFVPGSLAQWFGEVFRLGMARL